MTSFSTTMTGADLESSVLMNTQEPRHEVTRLIKDFLIREQRSRTYQETLEISSGEDAARTQQERYHCIQLEQKLAESQWSQKQIESACRRHHEDGKTLQQYLASERRKTQDLESRITTLLTINETLLKMSADADPVARAVEHERQQGQIKELQVQNETLKNTLQSTLGAFPFGASETCSDDSQAVIEHESGGCSAENPFVNDLEGQTWYKE